jgi:hypothetical protein
MNFSIDNTPPSKPAISSEERTGNNLTYTWAASTDPESGISRYMINLSYPDGTWYKSNTTAAQSFTFTSIGTGTYNVTIGAMNGAGIWRWSNEGELSTDTTPPEITATPNRTVITNTPIIRAWTDEQAVCTYNTSLASYLFIYTNTTYHEGKTNNLGEGEHFATITCTDMSGNTVSQDINFTINTLLSPDTVTGASDISAYESLLTTIPVTVESGSTVLAGITSDRFALKLDGKDYDLSVFDKGDGTYNVTFYAPETGTYELALSIDSLPLFSANLTVNSLYLTSSYSSPGIQAKNTTHITYYDGGTSTIGMASDEAAGNLEISSQGSSLGLTNIKQEENLFIFNTKPGLSITGREELLNSKNFMAKVIPSFGYQLDDTYMIDFILRYDAFAIESEMGSSLGKGYYNVLVKNTIYQDKAIIKFINQEGQQNKIILTSG